MNTVAASRLSGLIRKHSAPQILYTATLVVLLANAAEATTLELLPLLSPTAHIISFILGISFLFDEVKGYIFQEAGIVIAPACSGLRFFVISSLVTLTLVPRAPTFLGNSIRTMAIAVLTYMITITANVSRILTILMSERALYDRGLSPPLDLHIFLGSFTYLFILSAYALLLGAVNHVATERA